MATTFTKRQRNKRYLAQTPWGNVTAFKYVLETVTGGAVVDGDSTAVPAIGDTIRVGKIPAGFNLIDSIVTVHTAQTTNATADVGFEYVSGSSRSDVSADAAFFGSGLATDAQAKLRNATTKTPVTLPEDAWLTVKTGVAKNVIKSRIEITVLAIADGAK